MNDMLAIILMILKILGIVLLTVFVIAVCLLMAKTGIEYEIKIKNFDFSSKYKIILFGKKILIKKGSKKKKKEKPVSDEQKETAKTKRKISLSDIYEIKTSVFELLDVLLELSEKYVVFEEFNTKIVTALDNPAANGILYGGIQSVLNVIYAYFLANCRVKESELKIDYDFKSSEGLITENCGKIYVRPFFVASSALKIFICRKDIRGHIKKLIDFFKK